MSTTPELFELPNKQQLWAVISRCGTRLWQLVVLLKSSPTVKRFGPINVERLDNTQCLDLCSKWVWSGSYSDVYRFQFFQKFTIYDTHWSKNPLTAANICFLSAVWLNMIGIHSQVKWLCSSFYQLWWPVMKTWPACELTKSFFFSFG